MRKPEGLPETLTIHFRTYRYFAPADLRVDGDFYCYMDYDERNSDVNRYLILRESEVQALAGRAPYPRLEYRGGGNNYVTLADMRVRWNQPKEQAWVEQARNIVAENVPWTQEIDGVVYELDMRSYDPYNDLFGHRTKDEDKILVLNEGQAMAELRLAVMALPTGKVTWSRRGGYQCSTKGDMRFSAFNARMLDGRTLEMHYQCGTLDGRGKGFDPGGSDWRKGKGKPPACPKSREQLWQEYYGFWCGWAEFHPAWMLELRYHAAKNGNVLSDCFATSDINQARALAEWINRHPLGNDK